jgi:hypothetical protein
MPTVTTMPVPISVISVSMNCLQRLQVDVNDMDTSSTASTEFKHSISRAWAPTLEKAMKFL